MLLTHPNTLHTQTPTIQPFYDLEKNQADSKE